MILAATFAFAQTSAPAPAPAPSIFSTHPPSPLDPLVVTATRTPQFRTHLPFSVRTLRANDLRATPSATVDGALRSIPGFSLFRRSDSLTANPTAQGVSLRGLGPSGASRSLIVLDGVPLNDPFGGWVAWTLVPRDALAQAEVLRGGGATAWGNAALGGVVQLFSADPNSVPHPRPRVAFALGDFSTRSAELEYSTPVGRDSVQVLGRTFATDGFSLVAPERRGPIDVAAASEHAWLSGRWRHVMSENISATLTARTFHEERNNGTPFQRNASRANLFSLEVTGSSTSNFTWSAIAYGQDQGFSSTFSGVNATRTAETPASDQYAVPATAAGLAWTGAWRHDHDAQTSAGVDARRVRGETRERFTFVNGAFTRLRIAGGAQEFAGLFALHERRLLDADLRLLAGARLDRWRDFNGHRRESDLATGVASRDEGYAARQGTEFSPSVGLVWTPATYWRVRLVAQQAFRRPTLNELYRPFRVGPNITEANAALRTERVTSGELGVEWAPLRDFGLSLGAAAFWNELRDAVGNVTVARGPGTFPLFGTIAAGGVGRQRLNLDRTRVRGLELSARYEPKPWLTFTADYLYNDATVTRAAIAPTLVGKRVAQVPRQSAALGARWSGLGNTFTVAPRLRWIGRQFEDDENALRLGEVAVLDLGLTLQLNFGGELFLNVENLGNVRIETGRSADGVVNTGTPRFIFGGIRFGW